MLTFQDLILKLSHYWCSKGCLLMQPYDMPKGAGTYNPASFFTALGPEPGAVCFTEPSRRPRDGRYGRNPHRLEKHYQFQVVIKPSPDDILELYFQSLVAIGINPRQHDLRLEEDNWESPTLGAHGLGWQVLLDVRDNPVHLFPDHGRDRVPPRLGRDNLRAGAHRHVSERRG